MYYSKEVLKEYKQIGLNAQHQRTIGNIDEYKDSNYSQKIILLRKNVNLINKICKKLLKIIIYLK